MGEFHLHSHKQYIFQCGGLKEYDSLSSGAFLCVIPFFVFPVLDIRGITQINALPLKGQVLSPWCPHPPPWSPPLTPVSLHLLPQPFLPSRPCLRASPLEGQVNRGPGSAQARLVPIRSLIRHFISCLTANCRRQSSPQKYSVQYVCAFGSWFMAALRCKTPPRSTNQIYGPEETTVSENLMTF